MSELSFGSTEDGRSAEQMVADYLEARGSERPRYVGISRGPGAATVGEAAVAAEVIRTLLRQERIGRLPEATQIKLDVRDALEELEHAEECLRLDVRDWARLAATNPEASALTARMSEALAAIDMAQCALGNHHRLSKRRREAAKARAKAKLADLSCTATLNAGVR